MRFSRQELIDIITPHVLRTLIRLHQKIGATVTEADLIAAGLSEEQRQALVQTKRLVAAEAGGYEVQL
ncbi:hypothetical protein OS242_07345 [Tumebacillus sp. DT12]|uniref:Uncharacterized protein n=1 Tax=Tumebacillus lacus TaxID=2995335 RepID=A0ABT3WYQ8_9BACL|nr:hypothetical protein [Tumebacillus lacus]MCX7569776.1 hypothetical protein [Tumebacillus lacus]